MFNSAPSLCPPDAKSTCPVVTAKSVSRHCHSSSSTSNPLQLNLCSIHRYLLLLRESQVCKCLISFNIPLSFQLPGMFSNTSFDGLDVIYIPGLGRIWRRAVNSALSSVLCRERLLFYNRLNYAPAAQQSSWRRSDENHVAWSTECDVHPLDTGF